MGFFDAFLDELEKTAAAAPEGALQALGRRLPRLAGIAAVGAGGAAVGHELGRRKGERQGMGEGVALTRNAARQAYSAGVERGAEEMRDALLQSGGAPSEEAR